MVLKSLRGMIGIFNMSFVLYKFLYMLITLITDVLVFSVD